MPNRDITVGFYGSVSIDHPEEIMRKEVEKRGRAMGGETPDALAILEATNYELGFQDARGNTNQPLLTADREEVRKKVRADLDQSRERELTEEIEAARIYRQEREEKHKASTDAWRERERELLMVIRDLKEAMFYNFADDQHRVLDKHADFIKEAQAVQDD